MARMPRVVVPGYPHHVTQRGNRRQKTFFSDNDYSYYIQLMSDAVATADTEIWAYCLMPNHVHLVMVPGDEEGLRTVLGETHQHIQQHRRTGRSLGSSAFLAKLELLTGKYLARKRPGRKPARSTGK